jgi:hypothetical protein
MCVKCSGIHKICVKNAIIYTGFYIRVLNRFCFEHDALIENEN